MVGITVTLVLAFSGGVDTKLNCKVDKTVFDTHIETLKTADKEIKDNQVKVMDHLAIIHDNQIRVMEKLNIPPIRRSRDMEKSNK